MFGMFKAIREQQAIAKDLADIFDEPSNWAIHAFARKLDDTTSLSMAMAILREKEQRVRYGVKFGERFFGADMLTILVTTATSGKELVPVLKGILFAIEQHAKDRGYDPSKNV